MELELAVFGDKPTASKAIFFLRSDDYIDTLPADQQDRFKAGDPEATAAQNALKDTIKSDDQLPSWDYVDPEELPNVMTGNAHSLLLR